MKRNGKVYLVGAGPWDIGLLTLRAKELLEQCDVLIYDNLVNERVVRSFASERCEKIYVGKSGASHTMEQDDINRLIVEKAGADNMVVRLKGGDPYIFGRGGEEALYCVEQGVDFEIVNGISSAYAVPNYAGIPVTNRGYSASVAFITGHEDPTKLESDIRWDKLATGVQTLVFLMGVKNLPLIIEKLTQNGLDSTTPAAVIENGCQPSQRSVSGTLENIALRVKEAGIKPPSIIIVGKVVSLREKINWFEKRPLFGKRIVVTRSREQASELTARLTELGAGVIELPVIKIVPVEEPNDFGHIFKKLGQYNWIIFTSVNGADHFFARLFAAGLDSRSLSSAKICAIGPATGERLHDFGIKADLVPQKFISTDIIRELADRGEISGKSFLLPRADIAPKELGQSLLDKGAKLVDDIPVYRTIEEDLSDMPAQIEQLRGLNFDLVTFTSSSTVQNFDRIMKKAGAAVTKAIKCAAIGPITADRARELGYSVEISAEVHTIDGLVDAILAYYK
ncbi:MAG: uroporphyrinogen-III C-methyltransferase [Spirochaetes bacterium]|nr:uroporphyrinogen-III C-methyltransferase [Spirochaetota bacterium]